MLMLMLPCATLRHAGCHHADMMLRCCRRYAMPRCFFAMLILLLRFATLVTRRYDAF